MRGRDEDTGSQAQAGARKLFLPVVGPGSVGEDAWIFSVGVKHERP